MVLLLQKLPRLDYGATNESNYGKYYAIVSTGCPSQTVITVNRVQYYPVFLLSSYSTERPGVDSQPLRYAMSFYNKISRDAVQNTMEFFSRALDVTCFKDVRICSSVLPQHVLTTFESISCESALFLSVPCFLNEPDLPSSCLFCIVVQHF